MADGEERPHLEKPFPISTHLYQLAAGQPARAPTANNHQISLFPLNPLKPNWLH